MIEIIAELLTDEEKKIVSRLFDPVCGTTRLYVAPLGRYGHTGAKLYLCHAERGGMAFVIKTHDESHISDEIKANQRARKHFPIQLPNPEAEYEGARGGILYGHAGIWIDEADKVRPLSEVVYNFSEYKDDGALCNLVESVYKNKVRCMNQDKAKLDVGDHYRKYRRLDERKLSDGCAMTEPKSIDHSTKIIKAILGPLDDRAKFDFMGEDILNPRWFLEERLMKYSIDDATVGAIHGDLHADNILVDKEFQPTVIDFAWEEDRYHRAVDYTLLECSLRFLEFPTWFNPSEQAEVDEALLDLDTKDRLDGIIGGSHLEPHYKRLAAILDTIRTHAMTELGESASKAAFSEYLVSQFMILYGLLRYEGYSTPFVVRALGMIARRLDDIL